MENEKRCIYCGTTEKITVSDIVPDALTNARITNPYVCQGKHNSQMTEKFESEVAQRLAYLTNELNIKSSKSKSYPEYSAVYEIDGKKYEAKKLHSSNEPFKKGKIMWNKDHTEAFGDPQILEGIAKSHNSEYQQVDINDKEIIIHLKPDIEVFFSEVMYRQVAKIAFEWYCAKNKVIGKHDEFDSIINFITEGEGNDIVRIITKKQIYDLLDSYCTDGSHCLIGYLSNEGEIHVIVDMFGVIAYDIKVSRTIPEFCIYNCILQKLNVDSSRTEMCVKTYNDLIPKMLGMVGEKDDRFQNQSVAGINLSVCRTTGDIGAIMLLLNLVPFISNGIDTTKEWNEELINHITKQLNVLMQESVITLKSLKRFVSEKIGEEEIVFNSKAINKGDCFQYFILYIIGKTREAINNFTSIEKVIKDEFGKRSIDLSDEASNEIRKKMCSDSEYSEVIKKGAAKITQL